MTSMVEDETCFKVLKPDLKSKWTRPENTCHSTFNSLDKFLIEAGNAELFDGNARVDQALGKLGLTSQYQLLPGMEVALMAHQIIGVAWMVGKEDSVTKGGCLGDEMGLGKVCDDSALFDTACLISFADRSNVSSLLIDWKKILINPVSGLR